MHKRAAALCLQLVRQLFLCLKHLRVRSIFVFEASSCSEHRRRRSYVNRRHQEAKSAAFATICRRLLWWHFLKQDYPATNFGLFSSLIAPVRRRKWWQSAIDRGNWPGRPEGGAVSKTASAPRASNKLILITKPNGTGVKAPLAR